MRDLKFLKLFYGLMLVMVSAAFVSCVDDNDDTEAPFLEVSPTTLIFGLNGQPADGSQASFEIKANRSWKAIVEEDKSWVTLSKTEGEGSATIQVSIPENINDVATVVIQMSNKVGVLMSKTVTIKSGETVTPTVIYSETVGSAAATGDPAVADYTGWDDKVVTYSGTNASVRAKQSNAGGYPTASGPNNIFFAGAPAEFVISKIAIPEQNTNLKLTFGSIYVKDYDAKDYTFDMSKFEVYLSADGTAWAPVTYTKDNGDAEKPNWIFATSNFTLKQPVSSLYIKFRALDSSKFRVDDITLSTGNGGDEIDLGAAGDPKVTTTDAAAITESTATLGGSVANIELSEVTEVGIQHILFSTRTVTSIDWTKATKTAATVKESPWTVAVSGLTKDAQYAFRAYTTTATTTIYGEPKTFVAMTSTATQISIAGLVEKMTATSTAVDKDYEIRGIICGDPAGLNYSYGTLFVMTKGATTAGNALSLYNNQIDVTQYKLGQEIKVTLQKDVVKIYKRYDVPQVEGFSAANIEVLSESNTVTPIKVTVSQLASFVCMPVTIDNATIAESGVWKDPGALKNQSFTAGSTAFTVNFNKSATTFDNKPFAAGTGSITGIASIFSGAGQLMPRNLNDVSAFNSTSPTITNISPENHTFPAAGGTQEFDVTVANQGSNTLSVSGLSNAFTTTVSGNKITVVAKENTGSSAISETMKVSLTNGNSQDVVLKVPAKSTGGDTKGNFTSMTPFLPGTEGTGKISVDAQKLIVGGTSYDGLKIGMSKKSGAFTSAGIGVTGNKKLSFYAAAWKAEKMTVYVRVNGGGSVSGSNSTPTNAYDAIAGTGDFTVAFADSDYYTFELTGLTSGSTITIATDENFDGTGGKARGVMCGFQLY